MTRFFATKNCTASRLNAQSSFLDLPAVLVRFLNLNNIHAFWAIKVMHFNLMKNNMAALNNECLAKI